MELIEALDAKAREYMKRIIQDMVIWRKREAELIGRLITRNTRRLQERLSRYKLVPRNVWGPRAVVEGGPANLPEGEPYVLRQKWPRPQGFENLYYDTVRLWNPTTRDSSVTRDGNIIYKETVLEPASDTGETIDLPKYPFFDNMEMSPAELIQAAQTYLNSVYIEVVTNVQAEYSDCSMEVIGGDYHYLCRPRSVRYVALPPGEYRASVGIEVDFTICPTGSICLSDYKYHGEYAGTNIIYWSSDSTNYTISINWYILDGGFYKATTGPTTNNVYLPATIVLAYVVNENTNADVRFVSLHTPVGVFVARFTYTDPNNNWKYYGVAFSPTFKSGVKISQLY